MSFMAARPRLMTLAAGIFAPLTYFAAARLGAVTFPLGAAPTALVVALSWLFLTPLLLWVMRRTASARWETPRPLRQFFAQEPDHAQL
jgi:hypothetical protein